MTSESTPEIVEIVDEHGIVVARKRGRELAQELDFKAVDAAQVATVISELARNIYLYAKVGAIELAIVSGAEGKPGIRITARDQGPGIADLAVVMQDGYTTSGGLGLGLPGTKRIVDEFTISSEPGGGTVIMATKYIRRY